MHVCDLGLTKYMVEYFLEKLVDEEGNKKIDQLNERLLSLPRFNNLKIPDKGLQNRTNFTAKDWRNILKVIIFVIDRMFQNNNINNQVIICFRLWMEIYLSLRRDSFTKRALIQISNQMFEWANTFTSLFKNYSKSDFKLPKLHCLLYHLIPSIEKYGAPVGFSTETYESLHKKYVKQPYRSSNKRNFDKQMIKIVSKKGLKFIITTLITDFIIII